MVINSKINQKYETKFRKNEKHPGKHSNVHSSNKYLLSAKYVLGTDLVARDTALMELTFRRGEMTWKHKNEHKILYNVMGAMESSN